MTALPKFDFSSMNLKTDDDLRAATGQKTVPFFRVGKYETVIKSSLYKGLATDPTWGKVEIEYEGPAGQTIRDYLQVPLKDLGKYKTKSGKLSTYPAQKLLQFLKALGETVEPSTLEATMTRLFGKDNALKGMNVAIVTKYKGNYVQRQGDSIRILDKTGAPLVNAPEFADYEDAKKYAEANRIELRGFVDIVEYGPSVTPNVRKSDSVF